MSQEINLFNESLRAQRDWLAFDIVAPATLAVIGLIVLIFAYVRFDAVQAKQLQASVAAQMAAVQQEFQQAQAVLGARKNDPALEQEIQRLNAAVRQRKEVLALAEGSAGDAGADVAEVMRGFSRQIVDGVWLTGFSVGPAGFEIRGRLLDSSLLPAYIRRLNGEPAFRGRRFAALDMQGVEPVPPAPGSAAPQPVMAPGPARYTQFALRAVSAPTVVGGGKE